MTSTTFRACTLSMTAAAVALCLSAAAFAVTAADDGAPAKVKKYKIAKNQKTADTQGLYGSSETQKMRDQRLARECKGAANGGACQGYTR